MATTPRRLLGYARVSTAVQADEGESLSVQQRSLEGWAMMSGTPLGSCYVDAGVSGAIPLARRPEGARLLEDLRKGDTVVATRLDRMFRSAADALGTLDSFKAKGVDLVLLDMGGSVIGGTVGRLVFSVLAAVGEAERARIAERVSDVKRDQRQRSRYLGGRRPFGFRVGDDGSLLPEPSEQRAIVLAHELRARGLSLRAIAARLEAEAGQSLDHVTVRNLLTRPVPRDATCPNGPATM